jgi:hypothetical protein
MAATLCQTELDVSASLPPVGARGKTHQSFESSAKRAVEAFNCWRSAVALARWMSDPKVRTRPEPARTYP